MSEVFCCAVIIIILVFIEIIPLFRGGHTKTAIVYCAATAVSVACLVITASAPMSPSINSYIIELLQKVLYGGVK